MPDKFNLSKNKGDGEIHEYLECLPCKQDDLSSNIKNMLKRQRPGYVCIIPILKG